MNVSDPAAAVAPVRFQSAVDARGAAVIAAYGDARSAALGLLDVTQAPYAADPSGQRDATAALNRAIADARDARLTTYLPAGRYRVSGPIIGVQGTVRRDQWMFGETCDPLIKNLSYYYPCTLTGPREGGRAVIVLAPDAPGFADPENPQPVVFFWARNEMPTVASSEIIPTNPQANISFNQQIVDMDFDLGGNPGAIAIYHQGAQASVVEDVTIEATGAFAGLRGLPGSGGGVHGLRVNGGRYGIFARSTIHHRGSQPGPVVSDAHFTGQTEAALLYDGRGPLTLVGIRTSGAGIVVDAPTATRCNGPLNLIDSRVQAAAGQPAIRSTHAVYLANTFLAHTHPQAVIAGDTILPAAEGAWTHAVEWTGGPGRVMTDGHEAPLADIRAGEEPPEDLAARHTRTNRLPDCHQAANVRAAPYLAAGDGQADDTAALQRAIDENAAVFLPKGQYCITHPLRLHAGTRLFGCGPVFSTIVPDERAPAFRDALHPTPLVETVDDAAATTALAFLELRVPVNLAGAYGLRWRAGRHSLVRNINVERTLWDPDSPGIFHPLVRIEGQGGGSWYQLQQGHWWSQSPRYRHLLVEGTREPLRFYMLNPEHARCEAQVEFRDARHVEIFSLKGEGNYPVLLIEACRHIRVYGFSGVGTPWPGSPLLRLRASQDVRITQVCPQLSPYELGRWTALGIAVGPTGWFLIEDGETSIASTDSLLCYHRTQGESARDAAASSTPSLVAPG